jgi:CNT family concentrative nucleoside transporter
MDKVLPNITSAFGIIVLMSVAWVLSSNRRKINFRVVLWGVLLQFIFALLILKTRVGMMIFRGARFAVAKLLGFTDAGASFLFGKLYYGDESIARVQGGFQGALQLIEGGTGRLIDLGMIFAFHVLPTIVFFASLMSILYHLGIMQRVVQAMAWVMVKFMKVSGAESLSAASNIFVGQTEAPLVVRPYVSEMTMSELCAVMTGGFATIAGGVMAAYVRFGIDAGHLLAASVMSAPAALIMAKLMYPETGEPKTMGKVRLKIERKTANVIDAAATGAADGLRLALNVGAMLMAFISLIAMINYLLGFANLSLKEIFGYIFCPIAFVMGVDIKDCLLFGHLLGTKVSINEFVAYLDLVSLKDQLSQRSFVIGTYALCGFANFGSIAIQIGGISGIAPSRRSDLAKLGLRTMIAGALASWQTATIAGMLIT